MGVRQISSFPLFASCKESPFEKAGELNHVSRAHLGVRANLSGEVAAGPWSLNRLPLCAQKLVSISVYQRFQTQNSPAVHSLASNSFDCLIPLTPPAVPHQSLKLASAFRVTRHPPTRRADLTPLLLTPLPRVQAPDCGLRTADCELTQNSPDQIIPLTPSASPANSRSIS